MSLNNVIMNTTDRDARVETYNSLRARFVERLSDKDKDVRAMAAICLAEFCGNEGLDEAPKGEPVARKILLEALSTDPATLVRLPHHLLPV